MTSIEGHKDPAVCWYMVSTVSRKEDQVVDFIKAQVSSNPKYKNVFLDFKVAMVPHVTPKGKLTQRNLLPGYVFIKMKMTNDLWFFVRNVPAVTGLVGSSGHHTKPTPVSEAEMSRVDEMVVEAKASFDANKTVLPFKPGDLVRVNQGVLKGETGPVLEVDVNRGVVLVELVQFERKTPTEINLKHVTLV